MKSLHCLKIYFNQNKETESTVKFTEEQKEKIKKIHVCLSSSEHKDKMFQKEMLTKIINDAPEVLKTFLDKEERCGIQDMAREVGYINFDEREWEAIASIGKASDSLYSELSPVHKEKINKILIQLDSYQNNEKEFSKDLFKDMVEYSPIELKKWLDNPSNSRLEEIAGNVGYVALDEREVKAITLIEKSACTVEKEADTQRQRDDDLER